MPTRADELVRLRRDWKAHEHGQLAFANTIAAEHGWSSSVGEKLQRYSVMNSAAIPVIDELLEYEGVDRSYTYQEGPPAPSMGAREMLRRRADRTTKRLRRLEPEQRRAAGVYALERIVILQCILAFQITMKVPPSGALKRELEHWQALRSTIAEDAA